MEYSASPPGLLIGAYERDNFGDLLFLALTRHFLGDRATVATAPFAASLPATYAALASETHLPEQISAYGRALEETPAFVWVVGGEAGGTTTRDAYRMSIPAAEQSDSDFVVRLRENNLSVAASPYLPRPSRLDATLSVPFVVNSVGVSAVVRLTGRHRRETLRALSEASFLSVRERASHIALKNAGVAHVVAPDLVHSLTSLYKPRGEVRRDVALVQAKKSIIESVGVNNFLNAIATARSLDGFEIRFFSAGEAPGHDSTPMLHQLADRMKSFGAKGPVSVSKSATAWDKVDEIANSGLWVGTSLHGYIISTAYAVPRVGLALPKLRQYGYSWGLSTPTGVEIRDVDSAIEGALEDSRRSDHVSDAERLASAAIRNAKHAASVSSVELTPEVSAARSLEVRHDLEGGDVTAPERLGAELRKLRFRAELAADRVLRRRSADAESAPH